MCAHARGCEIDICYMLWMRGCENEYACVSMHVCTCEIRVRMGRGDAERLVTMDSLLFFFFFKEADLYSLDCAYTQPLVKSSTINKVNIVILIHVQSANERGKLLFNTMVLTDTTWVFNIYDKI